VGAGFGSQAPAFAKALRDAFEIEDVRELIYYGLEAEPDEVAPEGPTSTRVFALMRWVQKNGRERQLVDAVAEMRPDNNALQAVVTVVRAHLDRYAAVHWYEAPDPIETCFIRTDWPFLDRTELRAGLRTILLGGRPRTLVVRGTSGSGVSYSSHFVAEVVENESQSVYVLDVKSLEPGFTAEHVASSFIFAIGRAEDIEYMPPRDSGSSRYNLNLAAWVASEVSRTQTTWWLLLDSFDKVELRPDTVDFVAHLMRVAEMSAPHLRVVLLGCHSDVLPDDLEGMAFGETIESIERRNVEEFFGRLAEHIGREVSTDDIAAAVDKVLEEAPSEEPERLRTINVRLREVARVFADPESYQGG
jgi:hypothetical protein